MWKMALGIVVVLNAGGISRAGQTGPPEQPAAANPAPGDDQSPGEDERPPAEVALPPGCVVVPSVTSVFVARRGWIPRAPTMSIR